MILWSVRCDLLAPVFVIMKIKTLPALPLYIMYCTNNALWIYFDILTIILQLIAPEQAKHGIFLCLSSIFSLIWVLPQTLDIFKFYSNTLLSSFLQKFTDRLNSYNNNINMWKWDLFFIFWVKNFLKFLRTKVFLIELLLMYFMDRVYRVKHYKIRNMQEV